MKILIIDDHPLIQEALKHVLAALDPTLELVQAQDASDAHADDRQPVDVGAHEFTPKVSRSLMRPSLIRVLAVPSGTSSSTATSVWVYPPK